MDRQARFLSAVLLSIICVAFNSTAHADGPEFLFKSRTGRCLHIRGGDEANGGEVKVFDPCQTLPEFRVEIFNDVVLRIKLSPQDFRCLQVKQPIGNLPVRVTPGNCVGPSNWSVIPGEDGLSKVVLHLDDSLFRPCMREDAKTAQVVVDLCTEGANWKLEPIAQPPPERKP